MAALFGYVAGAPVCEARAQHVSLPSQLPISELLQQSQNAIISKKSHVGLGDQCSPGSPSKTTLIIKTAEAPHLLSPALKLTTQPTELYGLGIYPSLPLCPTPQDKERRRGDRQEDSQPVQGTKCPGISQGEIKAQKGSTFPSDFHSLNFLLVGAQTPEWTPTRSPAAAQALFLKVRQAGKPVFHREPSLGCHYCSLLIISWAMSV